MQLHLQSSDHLEETEEAVDASGPAFYGAAKIKTQPESKRVVFGLFDMLTVQGVT